MPTIGCPTCGKSLNVPAELLGKKVKCSACQGVFTAEAETAPAPPPPEPERRPARAEDEDRPRRRPRDEDEVDEDRPRRRRDEGDYEDEDRPRRRRRDVAPHRGGLVLTLGILSIVLSCCPITGIVLGAIAMSMGNNDVRGFATGRLDRSGEGMTNAGRICGIVGMCLGLLTCVGNGIFTAIRFAH